MNLNKTKPGSKKPFSTKCRLLLSLTMLTMSLQLTSYGLTECPSTGLGSISKCAIGPGCNDDCAPNVQGGRPHIVKYTIIGSVQVQPGATCTLANACVVIGDVANRANPASITVGSSPTGGGSLIFRDSDIRSIGLVFLQNSINAKGNGVLTVEGTCNDTDDPKCVEDKSQPGLFPSELFITACDSAIINVIPGGSGSSTLNFSEISLGNSSQLSARDSFGPNKSVLDDVVLLDDPAGSNRSTLNLDTVAINSQLVVPIPAGDVCEYSQWRRVSK